MTPKSRYDLIIAGAGPSGTAAALYAQHFGLDYLIIDRQDFPRDKVCGDAIAPVVFSLLKELGLQMERDSAFIRPSGFDFIFSGSKGREIYSTSHGTESLMVNCRRVDFDFRLFSLLKDRNRFLRAKLTDVFPERKEVEIETPDGSCLLNYEHLIIATGSGQNWLDRSRTGRTIYASRAYVKTMSGSIRNLVDFFEDIAPGYFWSFPVGNGVFNTGILFHTPPASTPVHEIHRRKLAEHLPDFEILSHTRWPLRIYSPHDGTAMEHIAAIGDANHSVDPVFGHGIDTGMLEAREQVRSLFLAGRFNNSTPVMQLIKGKNRISERCRTDVEASQTPADGLRVMLSYLSEVNRYYSEVVQEMQDGSV